MLVVRLGKKGGEWGNPPENELMSVTSDSLHPSVSAEKVVGASEK